MPRPPRADEAGGLYHALNRDNLRATIFHKDADYAAFERTRKWDGGSYGDAWLSKAGLQKVAAGGIHGRRKMDSLLPTGLPRFGATTGSYPVTQSHSLPHRPRIAKGDSRAVGKFCWPGQVAVSCFLRRDKLDGRSFESEKVGSDHGWMLEMGGVKLVVGFSCSKSLGMDACWVKQRFSAQPPHPQPFSPRKAGGIPGSRGGRVVRIVFRGPRLGADDSSAGAR
ncbi:hypothetical protein Pla52n_45150 [Stieleria varia]|uniref:Uncharacterized protein n=1 Tax=Stieleria varia TaxID=2528005 RepID=A0A5C6AM53_9BACT|nr:hypothetical protein Pla52n_45150 [Stieleria varia]